MSKNLDQQKINVKIRMEIEDFYKHDCMCDPYHKNLRSWDPVVPVRYDWTQKVFVVKREGGFLE